MPNFIVVIIGGLRVNQNLAMRIEKQFEKELQCDQCHLQIDCKLMDCHIKGIHCLNQIVNAVVKVLFIFAVILVKLGSRSHRYR